MKATRYATIAALIAIGAGSAFAQKGGIIDKIFKPKAQPRMILDSNIQRIKPIAMAGTRNGQVVTPYYPIVEDNDWPGGPWSTVFDTIELSPVTGTAPNGAPYENPAYGPPYLLAGNYGLTANAPGARFRAATTYEATFFTNDMDVNALYAGFEAQRVGFIWYWNPTVAGERMIVNIATTETFAATEAGLAPPMGGGTNNVSWSGFLDGVSLDFGNGGGAGVAPGGYFANINLDTGATPLDLKLPVDGSGAYILQLLSSTSPATLASRGQFYHWIAKQTNTNLPGGNHSNQNKDEWIDDTDITSTPTTFVNNSDGRHFTNPPGPAELVEFYDLTAATFFGPGPITEPAGATFGLYSTFGAFTAESSSDFAVSGGLLLGGTFSSLRKVDNNNIQILNDEINSNADLDVMVHSGVSTTTAISVIVATKATRSDVSEFVYLVNASNPTSLLQLNFRTSPLATSEVRVDVTTNAAAYVAPNGDVKLKFRWIPQNDIDAGDGWSEFVDRATVFVKGAQAL